MQSGPYVVILSDTSTEDEPCRHLLQELEHQSDPRHGSPSHTTAAMATADTLTQGSSGPGSGSRMVMDVDVGRQQSRQVTPAPSNMFHVKCDVSSQFPPAGMSMYFCMLACVLLAGLLACLPACLPVCVCVVTACIFEGYAWLCA